ncbi:MAG: hypothetical protein AB7O24_00730 [Kofleriaceae bacterium]
MRSAPWLRPGLSLLVLLGAISPVSASPAGTELRWSRGPGTERCIDEPGLRARLDQLLGGAPLEPAAAARIIAGRVDIHSPGFRAIITVTDDLGDIIGRRELVELGPDCSKLDDKLSLVIALLIDPEARSQRLPEAPATDREDPLVAERPHESWSFGFGVSGVTTVGLLPHANLGAQASLTVAPPRLPAFVMSAAAWQPETVKTIAGDGRFTLAGAGVAACVQIARIRRVNVETCLGSQAHRMTASGARFDANQHRVEWMLRALAEVGVIVPLSSRISATLHGMATVAVSRPRFTYVDGVMDRTVYHVPLMATGIRLGLALQL